MRLVLRGFMDWEAFSIDTFSGTAKRQSQRILASEAACHPDWILASMDVDKAFLKDSPMLSWRKLPVSKNEYYVLLFRREALASYDRVMVSSILTNPNIVFSVLNLEQVQKTHQDHSP